MTATNGAGSGGAGRHRPRARAGRLGFRGKAVLLLVPVIVIVSAAFTFEAIRTGRTILREEIVKRGETIAAIAARNAELAILSGNQDRLERAARNLAGIRDVSFVALYDSRLDLLVQKGAEPGPGFSRAPAGDSVQLAETPRFFEFVAPVFTTREGADLDLFHETDATRPVAEQIGWARIGISRQVLLGAERALIRDGVLLALLFSGAGILVVGFLVSRVSRPLRALIEATRGVREGEYSAIAVPPSGDEFGVLSEEFSRMSEAIRERERRIIESQDRLRSLFERVEHAIFRMDGDGNVLECNRKFDEIFPDRAAFRGLFPPGSAQWAADALAGRTRNVEQTVAGEGGLERTLLVSLYPYPNAEGPAGFDGYVVDVTEKKRLEEVLAQSQKLESVGMLAGGIAHDFSNIITGILGYAALIKLAGAGKKVLVEYADKIEQSATRAATLTRQLLGFARKGKFKVGPVDAGALAGELVDFLRETVDRSIELVTETEADLPPILGDSTQLYQALMNLCLNARDAMPDGGRLELRTESWRLETEEVLDCFRIPPGAYVRISVTDTGTGMTPEVKRRIFEPFFTTKEVGKGTGLGLSMVYGITKNHGGYVDVQSEPGAGTSVRLYFPVAEERPAGKSVDDETAAPDRSGTVLFVDDETVLRQLVQNTLESHSYRVFLAEDGVEGVRIFGEQKDVLDLVILDMNMPRKNGRQVFEEIRAVKPDAKILLCSGYGPEEHFEELFRLGAAGFVQKPFHADELLREVQNVLRAA